MTFYPHDFRSFVGEIVACKICYLRYDPETNVSWYPTSIPPDSVFKKFKSTWKLPSCNPPPIVKLAHKIKERTK
jgi:rubredoxin